MTHKERCAQLKEVRKQIADKLGIDLHQRECTYEGECKGTCPKCAQEEKILNKALLTGTVALSAVALTACGNSANGGYESRNDKLERIEKTQNKCEKNVDYDDYDDQVVGDEIEYQLAGDVTDDAGDYDGDDYLDGDVEYIPDDGGELAGEILPDDYYNYTYSSEEAREYVEFYSSAPVVELDHYDDDEYQYPVFHCYEIVDDGDGESHTATSDWLTVDLDTMMAVDFNGDTVDLIKYYNENN